MKALISNDDGITASGILASKNAVEDLCETYVVAPETQQSGIGHALTLYDPLRVNEHTLKDGSKGYGVGGTPTDAVTLALFEIMDSKPDIMISGINTGFNIGKAELTTSGTLGAAIEAASFGIPTISHQGCQVPFRPPIPNVGLLLRRCGGKGLHLSMTGEPRGFSRVMADRKSVV